MQRALAPLRQMLAVQQVPHHFAVQGGSVSQIAGMNRFSRMVPSGDPPPRPEPDSATKGVLEAAKNDRVKAIAECKAAADADAAEVEKAKDKVKVEAESSKILSKEAVKLELAADKAQKKLAMIRSGIKRLKESPMKGEVSKQEGCQSPFQRLLQASALSSFASGRALRLSCRALRTMPKPRRLW